MPTGNGYEVSSSKMQEAKRAFIVAKRDKTFQYEDNLADDDDTPFNLEAFKIEYNSVITFVILGNLASSS